MEDERFLHVKTDPKFRQIPKTERKVKIDKRFQSMFKDKKFKVKYTTDKRGRPVNHTSNEDLKRYYELSSESSDDDEPDKSDKVKTKLRDLTVDYARGESKLLTESSSSDDETEDEISDSDDIDHKWGELDAEAERTEKITNRLAACNMDWDRIRAKDLMVLFNSFLPPGGSIKSVAIYPSDYGKERMKEEELKGPTELVEEDENNKNDNEEGTNYHMEKLRQYQLNRLKYYYAIINFDNSVSANKVYTECDGMEYESSAIKLDLRFVPDDLEFDDDETKEICDELPEVNKYQPRFFTNSALQQAKVDLTWDETDPNRIEVTQKLSTGKIDELTKEELQNYLASSSDDSETEKSEDSDDDDNNKNKDDAINKYKALLQDIEIKEKSDKVEMEISWGINLKEKTDKLVKNKMNDDKTPFQQYLDKKKEKRKIKKKKLDEDEDIIPSDIDINDPYFAEEFNKPEFKKPKKHNNNNNNNNDNDKQDELELLLMNNNNDKKHFSLKQIQDNENVTKKKRKNKEKIDDDFQINVNDDRFSALFTSHHYNIDPTDSHYKKTKAMEILVEEKFKRKNDEVLVKKNPNELNYLVKSVKRKTNEYKNKF